MSELDLCRMKLRIKRPKSPPPPINSNLVFIIRTQGRLISSNGFPFPLHLCPHDPSLFPARRIYTQRPRRFLTVCNKETRLQVSLPEQLTALGEHNIIFCIEHLVNEIATVDDHFREVMDPFNKPKAGVLHGKKQVFNDRGDTGNREDKTNDLISKMN
ncbi:hypothetical protein HID58_073658 [Brassica napus]|uniref:Uncharacterized protein n=1 Tax=Brassica napus TaxID=3708 RepID=A0ABQ7Z7T8_BRANA|nr:hypothetical protein HID58_073658 [Brassica napus]